VRFLKSENPGILSESFIDAPAEPRGSLRFDAEHKVDLRFEKLVRVGGARISLQADIFNLFNANTVVRVQTLRADQSNFLLPAQIMFPRAVRLGARVTF
jgi:hypothetical protein